jgi:hypothetical protein
MYIKSQEKTMKNIFALTTLALGIAAAANGFFSSSAHAVPVTGMVEIKANVPEIVFLETYKDITFNLEVADLTSSTPGLIQTASGSVAAGTTTITSPLAGTANQATSKTFSGIKAYRTWGTGGMGGKIEHSASVSATGGTLTSANDATSTMALTLAGAATTAASPAAPGLDSTKALDGVLDFTFNLSSVKAAGNYTGGEITVSAEGI